MATQHDTSPTPSAHMPAQLDVSFWHIAPAHLLSRAYARGCLGRGPTHVVDVIPGAFQPFEPLCSALQRSLAMIRTIRTALLDSRLGSLPHHRHFVHIDYLHVHSRASFRCTASLLRPSNRLLSTATRMLSACIHVFPNRIPAHHTCPHHARALGRWAEARQDVTSSCIFDTSPPGTELT